MFKKVLAVCHGDSRLKHTWSGVPYMFLNEVESLLGKENVIRLNMYEAASGPLSFVRCWYNRINRHILGPVCTFERTSLFEALIKRAVSNAISEHTDISHILVFDLSTNIGKYSNVKICRIGDWTIDYEILNHEQRTPNFLETRYIVRQYNTLRETDFVATILPNSCNDLRSHGVDACYIGNGANVSQRGLPANKSSLASKYLLFIGGQKYKSGLNSVIASLRLIDPSVRPCLHVIGMDSSNASDEDFVHYHGYLSKDKQDERELYYSLLEGALAICNTTEKWSSAQSILEGMSIGLPVILNPNPDIKLMLGSELDFGWYCSNNPVEIKSCIVDLINKSDEEYKLLQVRASTAAKNYSWNATARRWINLVSSE